MTDNATKIADATAVGVNVLAGWTWLANLNEVLQFVLTIAGIVAAIAAARYHMVKTRNIKDKHDDAGRKD